MRQILLLVEFNVIIVDRLGKDNLVVDFFSRLQHEENIFIINANFLDEKLFVISCHIP